MANVTELSHCYGCGICALVCSKHVLDVKLNKDGFYAPVITETQTSKCTDCGLCLKVCGFDKELETPSKRNLISYAAWSNDSKTRKESTSGGICFEIGKRALSLGFTVCGVRYNAHKRVAEHYMASLDDELKQMSGSKYLQSFTKEAFSEFQKNEKYCVFGTPCQISSLKRYIQFRRWEENFILVDFFCHGVPSYKLWNYYIKRKERENGKVLSVKWRDKRFGWHKSYAMVTNHENSGDCKQKEVYSNIKSGDLFLTQFLGNTCLGKACYKNCKYKQLSSSADIRVGDFWGKKFKNNDEGVNSVIAFTDKGQDLISQLQDSCHIEEVAINDAAAGQMTSSAQRGLTTPIVKFIVSHDIDLYPFLWSILIKIERGYKAIKIKCRKLR